MDCDSLSDKYSGFGEHFSNGEYFPDCKVDIIRSSEEYGIGTKVVEKVIDLIRNSIHGKMSFVEDVMMF